MGIRSRMKLALLIALLVGSNKSTRTLSLTSAAQTPRQQFQFRHWIGRQSGKQQLQLQHKSPRQNSYSLDQYLLESPAFGALRGGSLAAATSDTVVSNTTEDETSSVIHAQEMVVPDPAMVRACVSMNICSSCDSD